MTCGAKQRQYAQYLQVKVSIRMMLFFAVCLLLAFALPVTAQNELPELDADYCFAGLRFHYPQNWSVELRSVLASTEDRPFRHIQSLNLGSQEPMPEDWEGIRPFVSLSVYENYELLDMLQPPAEAGNILTIFNNISNYSFFRSYFTDWDFKTLLIDPIGEDLLVIRAWEFYQENILVVRKSGLFIEAAFFLDPEFRNDWHDTVSAILNTITYEPDSPCPNENSTVFYVTNARDDGGNHYYASPASCATLHWNVLGMESVYITNPDGQLLGPFGASGELRTIPIHFDMHYTIYAGGQPGEVEGVDLVFNSPPSTHYPGNQGNGYIDPSCL